MSDPRASAGHLASLFVSLEVDSRKTKASCLNRTALIRLPRRFGFLLLQKQHEVGSCSLRPDQVGGVAVAEAREARRQRATR